MPSPRRPRPHAQSVRALTEALESRRLLAGQVVGTISNDLTPVDGSLGSMPLAGWTVYVDGNQNRVRDAWEPSATTDLGGWFQIPNVDAGTQAVRLEGRAGWT